MKTKQETTFDLSDDLKDQIASADLNGFIEFIADLLVEEYIRETAEATGSSNQSTTIESE